MDVSDIDEDDFLKIDDKSFEDVTNWLTFPSDTSVPIDELYKKLFNTSPQPKPPDNRVAEVKLEDEPVILRRDPKIDCRTFTRPRKSINRPSINSMIEDGELVKPRIQRKLTTTIEPTPDLINKLEELSRNNNRPVSAIYNDYNWEDGSSEMLADNEQLTDNSKHRFSIPASLTKRLEELKISNNVTTNRSQDVPMFKNDFNLIHNLIDINTESLSLDNLTGNDPSYSFININDYTSLDQTMTSSFLNECRGEELSVNNNQLNCKLDNDKLSNNILDSMVASLETTFVCDKTIRKHEHNVMTDTFCKNIISNESDESPVTGCNTTYDKVISDSHDKYATFTRSMLKNVNECNGIEESNNRTQVREMYSSKLFDSTYTKMLAKDGENGVDENEPSKQDVSEFKPNTTRTLQQRNNVLNSTPKTSAARHFVRVSKSFSPINKEYETESCYTPPDDSDQEGKIDTDSRTSSSSSVSCDAKPFLPNSGVVPKMKAIQLDEYKVAQRELKLKPALNPVRTSRALKKPVQPANTKLEPTVVRRPSSPGSVSRASMLPVSRNSGIPRPASKLRMPQVRASSANRAQ